MFLELPKTGPQSPKRPYTKHFPTKKTETQNPCILSKLILSLHQNSKTQIEMKKETIWGLLLLAPSRWDRYLGMTAAMTQYLSPRLGNPSNDVIIWQRTWEDEE